MFMIMIYEHKVSKNYKNLKKVKTKRTLKL